MPLLNITNLKPTPYQQTLFVVWGNMALFAVSAAILHQWVLLPVAFIGLHAFCIMSEASLHRYYSHRTYETGPVRRRLLRVFALLAGQGAILSWVTVHRTHHANEDGPDDPHSPHHVAWWRILTGLYTGKYKKTLVTDLMRGPDREYLIWENQNYWLLWVAVWVVSFILSPYLFYFIVAGSASWYLANTAVNLFLHTNLLGEKAFEDTVAANSRVMHVLTGIGYHNNHHKAPSSYDIGLGKYFDQVGWVIRNLLKAEAG